MAAGFINIKSSLFLDRKKVIDRIGKKRATVLRRTGARTMYKMKAFVGRKVTKTRKRSKPGEPPLQRKGGIFKNIRYAIDPANPDALVIGPVGFKSGGVSVPQLLNEGGSSRVTLPGGESEIGRWLPRPFATSDTKPFQEGHELFLTLIKTTKL